MSCKIWREILWENMTHRFIKQYFPSGLLAVAFWALHAAVAQHLARPSQQDDVQPSALPIVIVHHAFCHRAFGLVWVRTGALSVSVHTPQNGLGCNFGWPLAIASVYLGFMPKYSISKASSWKREKWGTFVFCFLRLYCVFIKCFEDISQSKRELKAHFIIKLMPLLSLFKGSQQCVCWKALLDRMDKVLGCISAAVSSTSWYLLFFSSTQVTVQIRPTWFWTC